MATLSDFPNSMSAGDSLTVELQESDYPASLWTLSFAGAAGTTSISATATGSGTTHTFSIAPATTAAWTPGTYQYAVYATKSGARETVLRGQMIVLPNLATSQTESHNRKTLRLIQAAIQGRAEDGIENLSLDGQSVSKMSGMDLLKWEGVYLARVAAEDRQISGQAGNRLHRVRFTTPS